MSIEREATRVGWSALLAATCAGLLLEGAHGLKLSAVLDDALTRELLRLAHAHAAGLALVLLVWARSGAPLFEDARPVARALYAAVVLVPLGFALGAFAHPEGDPSVFVWLVPLGAACLVGALARTAWVAWREP